jgi:hypothetical protein
MTSSVDFLPICVVISNLLGIMISILGDRLKCRFSDMVSSSGGIKDEQDD